MDGVRAITCHAWWAWAIVYSGKGLENRTRRDGNMPPLCKHRGPLLIHAGSGGTVRDYESARAWMRRHVSEEVADRLPAFDELQRGGIVGRSLVVAHVRPNSAVQSHPTDPDDRGVYADRVPARIDFRWFMDESHALVLVDTEPMPFIPCGGSQGLWTPLCQHFDCMRRPQAATHYSYAEHPDVKRVLLCEHHAALEQAPYRTAALIAR